MIRLIISLLLHLLILCMRLLVSAWLKNSWKLILLLTHKNLRLKCFVKKRLIILRKFIFLRLSINFSLREMISYNSRDWMSNSSFSSNKVFYPGTKVLNDILNKCKSHGDKKDLGYINKTETPTSGDIVFVKGKEETSNHVSLI